MDVVIPINAVRMTSCIQDACNMTRKQLLYVDQPFNFDLRLKAENSLPSKNLCFYLACKNTKSTREHPREWSFGVKYTLTVGNTMEPAQGYCILTNEKPSHLIQVLTPEDVERNVNQRGNLPVVLSTSMKGELQCFGERRKHDVIIEVDGERFHTIRDFLSLQSKFFEEAFETYPDGSRFELVGADVFDFRNLLEAMHGQLSVRDDTFYAIYKLAEKLKCWTVRKQCINFLQETNKLSGEEKLKIADKLGIDLEEESQGFPYDNIDAWLDMLVPPRDAIQIRPIAAEQELQGVRAQDGDVDAEYSDEDW